MAQEETDKDLDLNLNIEKMTTWAEDELSGKHLHEGEEFWFHGAKGRHVQGWIVKPKGWQPDQKKKWPVVLLIHGGPQGAWEDQWSTRWNPNGRFIFLSDKKGYADLPRGSFRPTRLLRGHDQPYRQHHIWARFVFYPMECIVG